MTSNQAPDATSQLQQFSMPVSDSWAPANEDATQTRNQTNSGSATTYRLQIQGDTITANLNDFDGAQTNSDIGKNPARVARRNARERRRIKNVNSAFDELRQHVPNGDRNRKKISKVDTLQSAIEYIKALEDLVRNRRSLKGQGGLNCDKENAPTKKAFSILDTANANEEQMMICDSASTDSENDDVIFVKQTQNEKPQQHSNNFTEINLKTKQIPEKSSDALAKKSNSKVPRPTEITESMLKAFDVMLQKCTSAKNVNMSSDVANTTNDASHQTNNGTKVTDERPVVLCGTNNEENGGEQPYNIQHQSNDSGFSEVLEQVQQTEKTYFQNSSYVNCNVEVETCHPSPSGALQKFCNDAAYFNQSASTSFPDSSASFLNGNQVSPAASVNMPEGCSQDTVKSQEQAMAANNNIVAQFAHITEDKLTRQTSHAKNDKEIGDQFSEGGMWFNPTPSLETTNFNYSPSAHATTLSVPLWPDAESDTIEYVNTIQELGESFDVQTSLVPTSLDQINPSIDLFSHSECSFDLNFSPAPSTSPYEQTNLPYSSTSNASNETGWILAQLN